MNSDNISEIVIKVASLARDFNLQRACSVHDLLSKSGYFAAHHAVGETELYNVLSSRSDLVFSWLGYSEDKRGGEGWYILPDQDGCIVGHLGRDQKFKFKDQAEAVAHFVKHEIESIRQS